MKKHIIILCMVGATMIIHSSCDTLDPNAPQACFVTPDEVVAGIPTAFNSSCSVNAVSFSWNFGDGANSTDANPLHTYAEEGTYPVTLSVTNDQGKTDETTMNVTVIAPEFIEHSGTIGADETWIEGTHVVTGDIYVDGATLTIEPGATILFSGGEGLYVGYHSGFSGSTLLANGTLDKPITFTSTAGTKSPGDWDFIGFYDGSSNASSLKHCVVEYGGGYSESYGMIYVDGCAITIANSIIRYSESSGLVLGDEGFFQSFTGNTVDQNGLSAIEIYGNYVHTVGTGNTLLSTKGIQVKGDRIEQENATWLKQTTAYVLTGDLYLGSESGAHLTLDPGVEVRLGPGTGIYVGYYSSTLGTLTAEGTDGDHIRFTSSSPDVSKAAGDWDYIGFYAGARTGSSMDYCDIEFGGGYSENYGMIYLAGSGLSLAHSTISNSKYSGISFYNDGMFTECTGNTFEGNGTVPIEIYGNYAHTIGTGNNFKTGPGILVLGDRIEQSDVTWVKQNVPYILDGDMYLGSETGAKLTIAPGTVVKFNESSQLNVGYYSGTYGMLVADAEPGSQIVFTSGAPAGFESPGDWDGIFFYDGTTGGTILDNCVISYGGGYSSNSGNLSMMNETAGVPVVSYCQIQNSAAYGIYLDSNASPTLTNNIFGNNASGDTN
jgi:parallel beta-helix repeat protein